MLDISHWLLNLALIGLEEANTPMAIACSLRRVSNQRPVPSPAGPMLKRQSAARFRFILQSVRNRATCLDVEKEAKVLEKEALSATGKSCVITSRVSPSQPSVVLPVVVV